MLLVWATIISAKAGKSSTAKVPINGRVLMFSLALEFIILSN